jgi:hypothetical protein
VRARSGSAWSPSAIARRFAIHQNHKAPPSSLPD